MLRSSLCDYIDAYILLSGTIIITRRAEDATPVNKRTGKRDKEVILKNCALFVEYTSEINNTQIDYAKDLGVVIPMYNLIEYSVNFFENIRNFMAIL